jgi:hypothetical protein
MAGSKMNTYTIKWHIKGKGTRTDTTRGMNAITAKKNFLKSIGGGSDVVVESVTKA